VNKGVSEMKIDILFTSFKRIKVKLEILLFNKGTQTKVSKIERESE
jgi:hypothetical protein